MTLHYGDVMTSVWATEETDTNSDSLLYTCCNLKTPTFYFVLLQNLLTSSAQHESDAHFAHKYSVSYLDVKINHCEKCGRHWQIYCKIWCVRCIFHNFLNLKSGVCPIPNTCIKRKATYFIVLQYFKRWSCPPVQPQPSPSRLTTPLQAELYYCYRLAGLQT